ncbi:MAG: PTS sugar transporter subunit IIA [Elusimicrobiales bacterium]|nr:PTS sugar transporter subunit IIA [Elusimicrobiales bacterium]
MTEEKHITIGDILDCKNIIIERKGFKDLKSLIDFSVSKIFPFLPERFTPENIKERLEVTNLDYSVFENGLFIPHLKLEDLDDFKSILIITPNPVKDNRIKHSIFITFMFFSPLSSDFFDKHLKILSSITQSFRDNIPKLISMNSPSEICSYIKSIR